MKVKLTDLNFGDIIEIQMGHQRPEKFVVIGTMPARFPDITVGVRLSDVKKGINYLSESFQCEIKIKDVIKKVKSYQEAFAISTA